jgi:aminoglycoside N3'-acetyltransferase
MSMSRAGLAEQLVALGVGAHGVVMIHASLRRIGPIDGGADVLIDALRDAVGPAGTLVMLLCADDDELFDARATPSDPDVGILAEVFRQRAGVVVNDHPAARMAALGPEGERLLADPPLHHYYGRGSPLERVLHSRGAVLRLGANIDTVTLTHHAEYLANIPNKRHARRRYVRAESGVQWIESLEDSYGIAEWPHGDYFGQIARDFIDAGHATRGPVGRCTAELFDGPRFVAFAVSWMETHLQPWGAGMQDAP